MTKLKQLVLSMIKIGLLGFGGGNALIPVIDKIVVQEKALIDKTQYEEDIVIASITPGALPVELAGGIGKRVAGKRGMLLSALAMAGPGVILTVLLLSVMSKVSAETLQQIEFIAVGITAFISCLLTDYIAKTIKEATKQKKLLKTSIVIVGVFVLTCGKNLFRVIGIAREPFFGLSTIHIFIMAFFAILFFNRKISWKKAIIAVLLCGAYLLNVGKNQILSSEWIGLAVKISMLICALYGLKESFHASKHGAKKMEVKESAKEVAVLVLFAAITLIVAVLITNQSLRYAWNGFLSSIMSFGGGDAYLTVADGFFVHTDLVTEDEFYSCLVPVVNVLPGSILCKTLAGVGYYIGYHHGGSVLCGCLVAFAGLAVSIAASCGVFSMIGCIYKGFEQLDVFQKIKRWIRPIVAGLMLTVILSLVYQNCKLGNELGQMKGPILLCMFCIYGIVVYLYNKVKMKNSTLVLISSVLSFTFCNILVKLI